MADELPVLEVNHQAVPMRQGDHHTPSVRRPHERLIRDLLLLCEQVLIHVQKDTNDRDKRYFSFTSEDNA